MSTPFPGMDPYLEGPTIWPGIHHRLATVTAAELMPQLRARGYFADVGERVWLSVPDRNVYPDVGLLRGPAAPADQAGTATLTADEPATASRAPTEMREPFVEIYRAGDERVVTGIEFLSPTNKTSTDGRRQYRLKQRQTELEGVHLVEIDLIRRGRRILDLPGPLLGTLAEYDYLANLGRRGGDRFEFYRWDLRDALPRMRIPLAAGDEDAVLDLRAVLDTVWGMGPYPDRIDYAAAPPPPALSPEDAAWLDALLTGHGYRGGS